MKIKKIVHLSFLIGNIFFCFVTELVAEPTVQLRISKNFRDQLSLTSLPLKEKDSVIDLLRRAAVIQTAYAGGFVTQINGIPEAFSNDQKNWFYYVNGILSQVGALQYRPDNGTQIWWDFHPWKDALYISAVVGAYPQPFVSGYEGVVPPTKLLMSEGFKEKVLILEKSMKALGVKQVDSAVFDPHREYNEAVYYVFIAKWEELMKSSQIKKAHKDFLKSGFPVQVSKSGELEILNVKGEVQKEIPNAAVFLAVSGLLERIPFWVITGKNEREIEQALSLLSESPDKIQSYSGVVIGEDLLENVPTFYE